MPDSTPLNPSMTSPSRRSPMSTKFPKNSSPIHAHNALVSNSRGGMSQAPCFVSFIPGRQSVAEFGAAAAGKGWAWLPAHADEKEQSQQQLRDANMTQVFVSLIHRCAGSVSIIIGINPGEPINGIVLKAAAVDLSRVKKMCVAPCAAAVSPSQFFSCPSVHLQPRDSLKCCDAVQCVGRQQHVQRQSGRSRS